MVDFEYWFKNVISEAELIASGDLLIRKWIDKEPGITSVIDQHELIEQLLGDLHLEECLQHFAGRLRQLDAFDAVSQFKSALIALQPEMKSNRKLDDVQELLRSGEWNVLKEKAKALIELSSSNPFRSRDVE